MGKEFTHAGNYNVSCIRCVKTRQREAVPQHARKGEGKGGARKVGRQRSGERICPILIQPLPPRRPSPPPPPLSPCDTIRHISPLRVTPLTLPLCLIPYPLPPLPLPSSLVPPSHLPSHLSSSLCHSPHPSLIPHPLAPLPLPSSLVPPLSPSDAIRHIITGFERNDKPSAGPPPPSPTAFPTLPLSPLTLSPSDAIRHIIAGFERHDKPRARPWLQHPPHPSQELGADCLGSAFKAGEEERDGRWRGVGDRGWGLGAAVRCSLPRHTCGKSVGGSVGGCGVGVRNATQETLHSLKHNETCRC